MKKANFNFSGNLLLNGLTLSEVPCEIIFPETQDAKPVFKANLDGINIPASAFPFKFGLEATILDSQGDYRYIISATKVYNLGIQSNSDISSNQNTILIGEPVNLKIREFFNSQTDKKSNFKTFYFWITPSRQLSPKSIIKSEFDGNVSVKTVCNSNFVITKDISLDFINYYFHFDDPKQKNVRSSKSVLAANFNGEIDIQNGEDIFDDLDLFLKLVSFSERRKVMSYGYKAFIDNEFIDFFRGDISIPKENIDHSINDVLIQPSNFQDFINHSLITANDCTFKDYLFDAISKASYCKYANIESEYLSYYAAIENLVNGYKDEHSLHFILDNESWNKFNKDLRKFIKNHDYFKNEKIKRKLIYEKISELNRVSFGSIFKSFCQFYKIDLSDLWSIGGQDHSLAQIRNLLIHGGRFEREKLNLLIKAKSHLKWILERCILRVLDWEIEHSNVSAAFLRDFSAYNYWQQNSSKLS